MMSITKTAVASLACQQRPLRRGGGGTPAPDSHGAAGDEEAPARLNPAATGGDVIAATAVPRTGRMPNYAASTIAARRATVSK
jgi:hypothetical protein